MMDDLLDRPPSREQLAPLPEYTRQPSLPRQNSREALLHSRNASRQSVDSMDGGAWFTSKDPRLMEDNNTFLDDPKNQWRFQQHKKPRVMHAEVRKNKKHSSFKPVTVEEQTAEVARRVQATMNQQTKKARRKVSANEHNVTRIMTTLTNELNLQLSSQSDPNVGQQAHQGFGFDGLIFTAATGGEPGRPSQHILPSMIPRNDYVYADQSKDAQLLFPERVPSSSTQLQHLNRWLQSRLIAKTRKSKEGFNMKQPALLPGSVGSQSHLTLRQLTEVFSVYSIATHELMRQLQVHSQAHASMGLKTLQGMQVLFSEVLEFTSLSKQVQKKLKQNAFKRSSTLVDYAAIGDSNGQSWDSSQQKSLFEANFNPDERKNYKMITDNRDQSNAKKSAVNLVPTDVQNLSGWSKTSIIQNRGIADVEKMFFNNNNNKVDPSVKRSESPMKVSGQGYQQQHASSSSSSSALPGMCVKCAQNQATVPISSSSAAASGATDVPVSYGFGGAQDKRFDAHTDISEEEKKFLKARVELEDVLRRNRPDSEVAQELMEVSLEYGEAREEWNQEKASLEAKLRVLQHELKRARAGQEMQNTFPGYTKSPEPVTKFETPQKRSLFSPSATSTASSSLSVLDGATEQKLQAKISGKHDKLANSNTKEQDSITPGDIRSATVTEQRNVKRGELPQKTLHLASKEYIDPGAYKGVVEKAIKQSDGLQKVLKLKQAENEHQDLLKTISDLQQTVSEYRSPEKELLLLLRDNSELKDHVGELREWIAKHKKMLTYAVVHEFYEENEQLRAMYNARKLKEQHSPRHSVSPAWSQQQHTGKHSASASRDLGVITTRATRAPGSKPVEDMAEEEVEEEIVKFINESNKVTQSKSNSAATSAASASPAQQQQQQQARASKDEEEEDATVASERQQQQQQATAASSAGNAEAAMSALIDVDDYAIEELLEDEYIDPDIELPPEPMSPTNNSREDNDEDDYFDRLEKVNMRAIEKFKVFEAGEARLEVEFKNMERSINQECLLTRKIAKTHRLGLLLEEDRRYMEHRFNELRLIYRMLNLEGESKRTMTLSQSNNLVYFLKIRNVNLARQIGILEVNLLERIRTTELKHEVVSLLSTQQSLCAMLSPLRTLEPVRTTLLYKSVQWYHKQMKAWFPQHSYVDNFLTHATRLHADLRNVVSKTEAEVKAELQKDRALNSTSSIHARLSTKQADVAESFDVMMAMDGQPTSKDSSTVLGLVQLPQQSIKHYLGDFARMLEVAGTPQDPPVARPLLWVRSTILSLIIKKLAVDAECHEKGEMKPSLCDVVYDYYLEQWHVRHLADVHLLELIYNLHAHARQPLVQLFARFCGMLKSLDRHYVDLFLYVLALLQSRAMGNNNHNNNNINNNRTTPAVLSVKESSIDKSTAFGVLKEIVFYQSTWEQNMMNEAMTRTFDARSKDSFGLFATLNTDDFVYSLIECYQRIIRSFVRKMIEVLNNIEQAKATVLRKKARRKSIDLRDVHDTGVSNLSNRTTKFPRERRYSAGSLSQPVLKERKDKKNGHGLGKFASAIQQPQNVDVSTPGLQMIGVDAVDVVDLTTTHVTLKDFREALHKVKPGCTASHRRIMGVYNAYTRSRFLRERVTHAPSGGEQGNMEAERELAIMETQDILMPLFFWQFQTKHQYAQLSTDAVDNYSVGIGEEKNVLHMPLNRTEVEEGHPDPHTVTRAHHSGNPSMGSNSLAQTM